MRHFRFGARDNSTGQIAFSLHAYRLVYRNILVLVHSLVIVPIVLIIFPHPIEWLRLLEIGPGICAHHYQRVAVSVLLGMISARFRDVPPIVANIVQVVFFLTPIMWRQRTWRVQVVRHFQPAISASMLSRALLGHIMGVRKNTT